MSIAALTYLIPAWLATGGLDAAADAATDSDPARPVIAVKEVPPAQVAYVEHRGPYWSIGPTLQRVREEVTSRGERSDLFVRFDSDPRRVAPDRLHARIGFFLTDGDPVPDSFQRDRRPRQSVAFMTVRGPHGATSHHYGQLHEWARHNGYEPLGPVVELYPPPRSGLGHADRIVEIQLAVRRAATETPRLPAEMPTPSPSADAPRQTQAHDAPRDRRRSPDSHVEVSADDAASAKDEHAAAADREPPSTSRIAALFQQGRFDDIAIALLPDTPSLTADRAKWLGGFIVRFRATALLARTQYGTGTANLSTVAQALSDRYADVFGAGLTDSFTPAGSSAGRTGSTHLAEARTRLDRLMRHVVAGKAEPAEVERDAAAILTLVHQFLHPQEGANGTPSPE